MFLGDGRHGAATRMDAGNGGDMSDIVLLGVIAAGLGAYCLHLQWKYKHLLFMMQLILEGLKKGDCEIVERNGVFFPVPKQQQEKA